MSVLRKRRLRLVVFLVRMWLCSGFEQRILPLAVLRNRFAAPLLLFIFGIVYCTFARRLHWRRVITVAPETGNGADIYTRLSHVASKNETLAEEDQLCFIGASTIVIVRPSMR